MNYRPMTDLNRPRQRCVMLDLINPRNVLRDIPGWERLDERWPERRLPWRPSSSFASRCQHATSHRSRRRPFDPLLVQGRGSFFINQLVVHEHNSATE